MYLFHTQLMQGGGALSSPAKQVITGVHLLNVTGIAISPSGMLFSTSAEGSVQKFQIGKAKKRTAKKKAVMTAYICSQSSDSDCN